MKLRRLKPLAYATFTLAAVAMEPTIGFAEELNDYSRISLYFDSATEDSITLRLSVPKDLENENITIMRCEGEALYIDGSLCEPEVGTWIQYPFLYTLGNVFEVNTNEPEFIDHEHIKSGVLYTYHIVDYIENEQGGTEQRSLAAVMATTGVNEDIIRFDALVKDQGQALVKFYFEADPNEDVTDVALSYVIDESYHERSLLDYLNKDEEMAHQLKQASQSVAMEYNSMTKTWEYTLDLSTYKNAKTSSIPPTKIDFNFDYQTAKQKNYQQTPTRVYVAQGYAAPNPGRYEVQEMHHQQVTLKWPAIESEKDQNFTYRIYSRPVQMGLLEEDSWKGEWRDITEDEGNILDGTRFFHNGVTPGIYYDYVMVAEDEQNFKSMPSNLSRVKTAYVSIPPTCTPDTLKDQDGQIYDPETDGPGKWYVCEGKGYNYLRSPVLFVHGTREGVKWWFEKTNFHGTNDMLEKAAEARVRSVVINLNDFNGATKTENSLKKNAALLAEKLEEMYNYFGEPIDIIAHSKGGVDTNYALVEEDAWKYVGNVVTLSSPHQGNKLADYAGHIGYPIAAIWDKDDQATKDMKTANMKRVRRTIDQNENVQNNKYYTLAGTHCGPAPSLAAEIGARVGGAVGGGILGAIFGGISGIILGPPGILIGSVIGGSSGAYYAQYAALANISNNLYTACRFLKETPNFGAFGSGTQNDGVVRVVEAKMSASLREDNPHIRTDKHWNHDNIRTGISFPISNRILRGECDNGECGEDMDNSKLLYSLEDPAELVDKLPERVMRGGFIEPGELTTITFPVEDENEVTIIGLEISSDYVPTTIIAPDGQRFNKWSEQSHGTAFFSPGRVIVHQYIIEDPKPGLWEIEMLIDPEDQEAAYHVMIDYGSQTLDMTQEELEQMLHELNPSRDLEIVTRVICEDDADTCEQPEKAIMNFEDPNDIIIYNVAFHITGNTDSGYVFERTVINTYDHEDYAELFPADFSAKAKRSKTEITEQALKTMDRKQLDAFLNPNQ